MSRQSLGQAKLISKTEPNIAADVLTENKMSNFRTKLRTAMTQGLNSRIDKEIPASGGNLLAKTIELRAIANMGTGSFYRIYLSILKYLGNLYQVKNSDTLEKIWPLISATVSEYGMCAIYFPRGGGEPRPMALSNAVVGYSGKIVSGVGIMPNQVGINANYQKTFQGVKLTTKNALFIKSGVRSLPMIFNWYQYIEAMDVLIRIISGACKGAGKRIKFKVFNNDLNAAALELETYFDYDTPLMVELNNDAGGGINNRFEPFDGQNDYTQIERLKEIVESTWFNLLGRRPNSFIDKKRERTNQGEVSMEIESTNIYELDLENELKWFIKEWNKATGESVELISAAHRTPTLQFQYKDDPILANQGNGEGESASQLDKDAKGED